MIPCCNVPNVIQKLDILFNEVDCDISYLSKFNPDDILNNKIFLLNESIDLKLGKWNYEKKSHLWNFNLHYFEYAIALAVKYQQTKNLDYYKKYRELYIDWYQNNNSIKSDGWHPYTISLRIINIFIANELFTLELQNDSKFFELLNFSLYQQFLFLEKNQELHLLGNHYFENIKTLYISSVYFNDQRRQKRYEKKILRVLEHQILDDGMHYELSFMYHQILIEGLLRVYSCSPDNEFKRKIKQYIFMMLNAANYMELGINRLPLFNDAGMGVAKELSLLNLYANTLLHYEYVGIDKGLKIAGYYRFDKDNFVLLIDCGRVGADEQPGHAHCDALSYELFFAGHPFIVNSGTYHYQTKLRAYFRSTKAHNTIVINGHEQSDCWAEHRVANRIKNIIAEKNINAFRGSFVNIYGEKHERTFKLYENEIEIEDEIFAKNIDSIEGYLHIHPSYKCISKSKNEIDVFSNNNKLSFVIQFNNIEKIKILSNTYYSDEFGILKNCTTIEYKWAKNVIKQKYIIREIL